MSDDPNEPDESTHAMPMGEPIQPINQPQLANDVRGNHAIENLLSQVIHLNNENDLHEPTCLICSSALREEAEELWKTDRKEEPIIDLFKNRSNLGVSKGVVKNHMDNHKDQAVRELQKVEYVDRIKRLYGNNMSTLDQIEMCLAVLLDRIMAIGGLTAGGDKSHAEIEKLKCAETDRLTKTFGTFLKLQATIKGEMKAEGELITIPKDKFVKVFQEAIIHALNDREREIISGILNGLNGMENK